MIRNDVTNVTYMCVCNYSKKRYKSRLLKGFIKLSVSWYVVVENFYNFLLVILNCFVFPNNVILKRLIKTPGSFPAKSFFKKKDETYSQLR